MEALRYVVYIRCAVEHDLLFKKPASSSVLESEESWTQESKGPWGSGPGILVRSDIKDIPWDGLLIRVEVQEVMDCSE